MENSELIKRAEDLARRCQRSGKVCATGFLSPAEQYEIQTHLGCTDCRLVFSGGTGDRERRAAFFLPDYMEEDQLDVSDFICAMELKAYFGTPGHRDYMGALLGMGIGREWLGDIQVEEDRAYVFCMNSVLGHLLRAQSGAAAPCGDQGDQLLRYEHEAGRRGGGAVQSLPHRGCKADSGGESEPELQPVPESRLHRERRGYNIPERPGQGQDKRHRRHFPERAALCLRGNLQVR